MQKYKGQIHLSYMDGDNASGTMMLVFNQPIAASGIIEAARDAVARIAKIAKNEHYTDLRIDQLDLERIEE